MKQLLLALLCTVSISLAGQQIQENNGEIVGTAVGDLDKDGIAEKVQVVEYPEQKLYEDDADETGVVPVELQVFKQKNGKLFLWLKTRNPMNNATENDAYYDRFSDIKIVRGCIVIKYIRENSGVIDDGMELITRYRYQNNGFYLIGATYVRSESCRSKGEGEPAATVTTDINFATGRGIQSFAYGGCWSDSVKLPKPKTVQCTLKDCATDSDLKNITIANHKYGEIELSINGESISF